VRTAKRQNSTPAVLTQKGKLHQNGGTASRGTQDEILMGVRRFEPNAGKLDFPGGFVLPGEDIARAAAREVKEEFGVKVDHDECILLDCLSELVRVFIISFYRMTEYLSNFNNTLISIYQFISMGPSRVFLF
jgi:ADP-ribose pyrophosphatase YjhB (NUDIX family)